MFSHLFKMISLKCLACFLLLIYFQKSNSLRSFDIRWRRVNCSMVTKSYFGVFNCSLNEWPRNRGNYLSANLLFTQDIKRILLDFSASVPGPRKNLLFKFRPDGCQMSKYHTANPMISSAFKQMYQSSNFPRNCPLKANITYNVKGLSLNPDYFPGNTPEMTFYMNASMFTDNIHVLAVQLEASIQKKKNKRLPK